jgi:hypothetical protein
MSQQPLTTAGSLSSRVMARGAGMSCDLRLMFETSVSGWICTAGPLGLLNCCQRRLKPAYLFVQSLRTPCILSCILHITYPFLNPQLGSSVDTSCWSCLSLWFAVGSTTATVTSSFVISPLHCPPHCTYPQTNPTHPKPSPRKTQQCFTSVFYFFVLRLESRGVQKAAAPAPLVKRTDRLQHCAQATHHWVTHIMRRQDLIPNVWLVQPRGRDHFLGVCI